MIPRLFVLLDPALTDPEHHGPGPLHGLVERARALLPLADAHHLQILLRLKHTPLEVVHATLQALGAPHLGVSVSAPHAAHGWPSVHVPEGTPYHRPVGLLSRAVHHPAPADLDADVALFAPVFAPRSKHGEGVGLAALTAAARVLTAPIIALGGVTEGDAGRLLQAGAWGIAGLTPFCTREAPLTAARRWLAALDGARGGW